MPSPPIEITRPTASKRHAVRTRAAIVAMAIMATLAGTVALAPAASAQPQCSVLVSKANRYYSDYEFAVQDNEPDYVIDRLITRYLNAATAANRCNRGL